tara:strand:- start:1521 stop:1853 length:333 start_codon:yes stop_codon:yes gene_type:complete
MFGLTDRQRIHFTQTSESEHILLVDGLFDLVSEHPLYADAMPIARCLCGVEVTPQSMESIWISLIPGDEDYIIGFTEWIGDNSVRGIAKLCDTCYTKATQMEKIIALGGG